MIFHSGTFLVFFLVFLSGFHFLKPRQRILYTTFASFIFYSWWYPPYLLLLIGFAIFAYYAAHLVSDCSRVIYAITLGLCLSPLCFFKYTHFFLNNLFILLQKGETSIGSWKLPLGISFITFTVMAYLIDVRRRLYYPEKSFLRVALYLSFFPHLIAGPIMRPKELFPQLEHLFIKQKLVRLGIFLFSIGLIKKIFFADTLAPLVEAAYQGNLSRNFLESALAFYAFAVQIYCDFSGYVDMAFGLAFILGVRLPLNFNRPYLADSPSDFWKRWHITLSRWLKDYLYISLGGSKRGAARTFLALMVTMLIGGLWHGAAWTFVLWGGYHGVLLAFQHFFKAKNINFEKIPLFFKRFLMFHLVGLGWVLFRSKNLGQAYQLMSGFWASQGWKETLHVSMFAWALIVIFFMMHAFDRVSFICWFVHRQRPAIIYAACAVIILASMVFSTGNPNAFIYFEF